MTSVAYSPYLRQWIGLGLLKNGPSRIGERIRGVDPVRNSEIQLRFAHPCSRS